MSNNLVREEILTRLGFRNRLIHFAILFAGLVLAGFSGLLSSGLLKTTSSATIFLLFSGLAFQFLNLILTEEEETIAKLNSRLTKPVFIRKLNGKFLFVFLFGLGIPIFAWLYLLSYAPKLSSIEWVILSSLSFANTIILISAICKRICM